MNGRDCNDLVRGLFGPLVQAGALPCVAEPEELFAEERVTIADAGAQRQNDFATGRVCARRLLARFGVRDVVLPKGPDGAPHWPADFVGSIAHSAGVCIAAVARRADVGGVGIDIEAEAATGAAMWDLMCTARELTWLRQQPNPERAAQLATALFSAKESVYKSFHGDHLGPFEPTAIEVEWDGEATIFHACMSEEPSKIITGTLIRRRGWILSGVALR